MTEPTLHAVGNEFVIRLPGGTVSRAVVEKLEKLGSVEPLPARPDTLHLRLKTAVGKAAAPKTVWKRIQKIAGDGAQVIPVLVGEGNESRYPVGTIVVRFKAPPSERELAQLADDYGLKLEARNKYVPAQASFTAAAPDQQYLPDVLKKVNKQHDIVAAWPETLSKYRRE